MFFQSVYNMLDAVGAKPKDDPCARAGMNCSFSKKLLLIVIFFIESYSKVLVLFFVQMKSSRGLTWTMMGS